MKKIVFVLITLDSEIYERQRVEFFFRAKRILAVETLALRRAACFVPEAGTIGLFAEASSATTINFRGALVGFLRDALRLELRGLDVLLVDRCVVALSAPAPLGASVPCSIAVAIHFEALRLLAVAEQLLLSDR